MDILFENTTVYTKKEINEFMKFHTKKYTWKFIVGLIFFIVYFGILIIFNLVYKNWKTAIAAIIISIGAYVYYKKIYVDRKVKNNKQQLEQSFTFKFYDKNMTVESEGKKYKIRYHKFRRVFETERDFYLYYNKEYSILMNKNKFTVGTPQEFTEFIKKRTIFKYRLETKNEK